MANKEASLLIRIKEAGGEVLDKVNAKTLLIGVSVALVAKKLFDFGAEAFKAFAEAEAATNKLNQALVQQGIYTAGLSEEYRNLAGALQKKSIFSDEEIMSAQATMTAYLGQTKISGDLLKATLDLASAKGIDLVSAADMVAKSIGTGTNVLARQGLTLDQNASKTEKLAAVTSFLNGKFGGQAEAATSGTGALKTMNNVVGELMEKIGGSLAPLVTSLAQKTIALSEAVDQATWIWEGLHAVMYAVGATFSVVEMVVTTVVGSLIQSVQSIARVWTALASGDFASVPGIIGDHFVKMADRVVTNFDKMIGDVSASYDKHNGVLAGRFRNEEDLLRASEQRQGEIRKEAAAAKAAEAAAEYEADQVKRQEAFEKERQDFAMKSEQDMVRLEVERQVRADLDAMAKLEDLNRQIAFETDRTAVMAAEEEKRLLLKKFYDVENAKLEKKKLADKKIADEKKKKEEYERLTAVEKFEAFMDDKKVVRATQTMNDLSRMQNSKSKELVAIGRAAAMANVIMQTAQAVMNIWGWASAIPIVGPAIAVGLSAAVIAHGAESISNINSAQMAEGGIVTARPGGMLATIGEGGRDEAVIPLEDGKIPGTGGGGITLNVYGGLLGDDISARELARALDRELLKLQQSGDSVSSGRRT